MTDDTVIIARDRFIVARTRGPVCVAMAQELARAGEPAQVVLKVTEFIDEARALFVESELTIEEIEGLGPALARCYLLRAAGFTAMAAAGHPRAHDLIALAREDLACLQSFPFAWFSPAEQDELDRLKDTVRERCQPVTA